MMDTDNVGVTSNYVRFVRGGNTDGVDGLKDFVPTTPMVRNKSVSFVINLDVNDHVILTR